MCELWLFFRSNIPKHLSCHPLYLWELVWKTMDSSCFLFFVYFCSFPLWRRHSLSWFLVLHLAYLFSLSYCQSNQILFFCSICSCLVSSVASRSLLRDINCCLPILMSVPNRNPVCDWPDQNYSFISFCHVKSCILAYRSVPNKSDTRMWINN